MAYDQNLFNIDPYYDDFNEDKKFHRVLFRPGYAVQARELTQLQTVLQNQISRFGDHIFEDGSKVFGGEISVQNGQFLRCNKGLDLENFIGYEITQVKAGENTPVSAKVVHGIGSELSESDDYDILLVSLISGSTFEPGGTFASSFAGASLDGTVAQISSTVSDGTSVDGVQGRAKLIQVSEGIYYTDGYFAKNDRQVSTIYSKNVNGVRDFDNPTGSVGFNVIKEIVDDEEDTTLKDPASGTYNYNAPGATRLKVDLDFGFTTSTPGKDFIEIAKFSSGDVEYQNIYSDYAELEDTMARRTYDESGSYVVDAFDAEIKEHLSDGSNRGVFTLAEGGSADKLAAVLDPGKAYVFGYEFETQSPTAIAFNKSRTTSTSANQRIPHSLGNVFRVELNNDNKLYHNLIGPGANVVDSRVQMSLFKQIASSNVKVADLEIHKVKNNSLNVADLDLYATNVDLKTSETLKDVQAIVSSGVYFLVPRTDASNLDVLPERRARAIDLTLPNFDTLLYELPQGKVAKSVKSLSFLYQERHQVEISALSSSLTIQTKTSDSSHKFYNPDATGTNILVNPLQHYAVYYTADGQNFTRFNDSIESGLNFTITTENPQSLTITGLPVSGGVGTTDTVTYIVVATVEVDDDAGSTVTSPTIRTKTLTTISDEVVDEYVTDENGDRYIQLSNYDVYDIVSATGITAADFGFDDGQRESFYDYGRLYFQENLSNYFDNLDTENEALKEDLGIEITYRHFAHGGGPGPFTVDSYTNSGLAYESIPLFASKELNKTLSLASCVDFRHSGTSEDGDSGAVIPDNSNISVKESHEYYESRIDKLVLRRFSGGDEVDFEVIEGVPDLVPEEPDDRFDAMTLYSFVVPPYTHNPNDVKVNPNNNFRYTMKDIGKVDKRVETLEYFSKLSLLEREIESKTINKISPVGSSGTKTGILVDSFLGHNIGNVQSPRYNVSVDYENQICRNGFVSENVSFGVDDAVISGNLTLSSDNILHLTATETSLIDNSVSSSTENVNKFNLSNWIGGVELSPQTDDWFDDRYRPIVKFNQRGENDNWLVNNYDSSLGFGTRWNDWETTWFGIEDQIETLVQSAGRRFLESPRIKNKVDVITPLTETNTSFVTSSAETTAQRNTRFGLTLTSASNALLKKINNKIVDASIAPFMRSKTISIEASNLKPNTRVYPFFDGVDVASNCGPSGGTLGGEITTDSVGRAYLDFTIPVGTFTTGSRIFRLIDSPSNSIGDAETSADGVFHATGAKKTEDTNYTSVRPAIRRRQSADSEKVVGDPATRSNRFNSGSNVQWSDPLAQIFTVSQQDYPDGLFLHNVELFFATKSESLPVTLQIRPLSTSGRPSSSTILPFSEVIKNPNEVTAVEGGRGGETKFEFTTPVFLQPGNYAVVVVSNSDDYTIYTADNGLSDDITGNKIQSAANMGSLYIPQNYGEILPSKSRKMAIKINKCVFSTSGTIQVFSNEVSSDINADYMRVNSSEFLPRGCDITNLVSFGLNSFTTKSNKNRELSSRQVVYSSPSSDQIQKNTITLESNNTVKSPMIDMDSYSLNAISNRDSSTYITRQVTLDTPSKEIHVFVDQNYGGPISSVRARALNTSDTVTSIENAPTFTMDLIEGEDSESPVVFKERHYGVNIPTPFDKFVIEIDFETLDLNDKKLPVEIKDFRVVTLL